MFLVTSLERVNECTVKREVFRIYIISYISLVSCCFLNQFPNLTTLQSLVYKTLKRLSPKIGDNLVTTLEAYPTFGNVVYHFVTRLCDKFLGVG